uniref:Uncharacterized protein n=1 Tax=Nelumbo nucifera TaxID=4432 RepID=A0A822XFI2_NELNU|nr:TPA_asm: hypothetical protein HUJ06_020125 [Nelumbo nucifera]
MPRIQEPSLSSTSSSDMPLCFHLIPISSFVWAIISLPVLTKHISPCLSSAVRIPLFFFLLLTIVPTIISGFLVECRAIKILVAPPPTSSAKVVRVLIENPNGIQVLLVIRGKRDLKYEGVKEINFNTYPR